MRSIDKEAAKRIVFPFFTLAATAFILTSILGVLASLKVAIPSLNPTFFPFEKLRPLHTFFSIVGVLAGGLGWVSFVTLGKKKSVFSLPYVGYMLLSLFTVGGGLSLLLGMYSGREYFSWTPLLSIPLVAAIGVMVYLLFSNFQYLSKKSPEGTWLIGFGSVFVLVGVSESFAWLLPPIGNNFVRDLTFQWHSIDTFYAGLNAFFYGLGVFVLQKDPKPLRKTWLYVIAISSLLFTFGHHHYVSPQPHFLKILALIASMIAMFSFIKHLRIYRKREREHWASKSVMETLFLAVELWTIVSFASGILFAVPMVNLVVHGTYLIVIHSMGSVIGVQLVLVFIAGFSIFGFTDKKSEYRIKLGVRLLNVALILLWVAMGIVGVLKGVLRFDHTYYQMSEYIGYYLYLVPVVGLLLLVAIVILSMELLKSLR